MPSHEDYLDNLLKGLNGEPQEEEIPEAVEEPEISDIPEAIEDMEISDIPEAIEDMEISDIPEVIEDMEIFDIPDAMEVPEIIEPEENMDTISDFDDENVIGVDDTKEMTAEEIEKLLSETEEFAEEDGLVESAENSEEDLMELLSNEESDNYQEIQELLQKSDNNEAVNEEIMALLQDTPDETEDLLENILQESESDESGELFLDEKAQRAAEKKRERDARRAEKVALREAKKTAKLEAKAAKDAEKQAKKEAAKSQKQAEESPESEGTEDFLSNQTGEAEMSERMLQQDDLADLDALLSMAENAMMSNHSESGNSQSASAPVPETTGTEAAPTFNDDFFSAFSADEIKQTDVMPEDNPKDSVNTDSMVDKIVADKQRPQKKKMISRLLDLLTESDEDDEATTKDNENIQLSDENKTILEEKDKEKKKKGKKGKKGKKDRSGDVAESQGEEGGEENQEEKPKKEKKAKKEKIPKEIIAEEPEHSGSKLSMKKILPVVLVCLSLVIVVIIVANLSGDYSAKQAGREAYYNEDYQTCYQALYGKDLNESEQVMFNKSESILRIRLWIREYEMFVEEGAEAEALDSLIQSVNDYPTLYAYADQWTAGADVAELYGQILSILSEKYQLTEAQALEIADAEEDEEYSRMVYAIIDGKGFGSWNQQVEADQPEVLQDVLPEEEDIEEIPFVDNNDI